MVPDLHNLNHPTDAEHWRKWIAYGRPGSMMPAFAQSEGGPLTHQQINVLVDYMVKVYPNHSTRTGHTTVSPRLGPDVQSISAFPAPKAN